MAPLRGRRNSVGIHFFLIADVFELNNDYADLVDVEEAYFGKECALKLL